MSQRTSKSSPGKKSSANPSAARKSANKPASKTKPFPNQSAARGSASQKPTAGGPARDKSAKPARGKSQPGHSPKPARGKSQPGQSAKSGKPGPSLKPGKPGRGKPGAPRTPKPATGAGRPPEPAAATRSPPPPVPRLPLRPPTLPPGESRAGFIAIMGQPNVGKSTLLNYLLGEKLAIVSDKPQTTRVRLLGVKHLPGAQLALVDTPGLHRPSVHRQTLLNRYMIEEARAAASDVDALLLVIDASKLVPREAPSDDETASRRPPRPAPTIDATDRFIIEQLAALKKPMVLAINKVDRCKDKTQLLPIIEAWNALPGLSAIVPVSALRGTGLETLQAELCRMLPLGPALFPEDMLTDAPERLLCAERIREQLYLQTHKELPYATAITIDAWEERISDRGKRKGERGVAVIHATIHVEKPNQKMIVIGEGGSRIREVGRAARAEMEALLDCSVHLELFVRVDADWSHSRLGLREMGYTQQSGTGAASPGRA